MKVELNEREARSYFSKRIDWNNLGKKAWKYIHCKESRIIAVALILATTVVSLVWLDGTMKSQYREGYAKGMRAQITQKIVTPEAQRLQGLSLGEVWEWFAKKVLIVFGMNLSLLMLVGAIVWLWHGSLFKIF